MIITRVGRRGQITIPKAIRRQLDVKEGDRITFIQQGNDVILQPLSKTLLDMRGSVPVSGVQDFTTIRRQVLQTHAREVAHDET